MVSSNVPYDGWTQLQSIFSTCCVSPSDTLVCFTSCQVQFVKHLHISSSWNYNWKRPLQKAIFNLKCGAIDNAMTFQPTPSQLSLVLVFLPCSKPSNIELNEVLHLLHISKHQAEPTTHHHHHKGQLLLRIIIIIIINLASLPPSWTSCTFSIVDLVCSVWSNQTPPPHLFKRF